MIHVSKTNGGYAILDLSEVAWEGEYPAISGKVKEGTYESIKATIDSGKAVLITGGVGLDAWNFNTAFASSVGLRGTTLYVSWLAGPAYVKFAISPDESITYEYAD